MLFSVVRRRRVGLRQRETELYHHWSGNMMTDVGLPGPIADRIVEMLNQTWKATGGRSPIRQTTQCTRVGTSFGDILFTMIMAALSRKIRSNLVAEGLIGSE